MVNKLDQKLDQKQKGAISLIVVVLLLSSFLIIALAIASLLFKQIIMSVQLSDSVGAYQAADSGIEYALYQKFRQGVKTSDDFFDVACVLGNWSPVGTTGAFCLEVAIEDEEIVGIKSIGKFNKVRRAIEIEVSGAVGGEPIP